MFHRILSDDTAKTLGVLPRTIAVALLFDEYLKLRLIRIRKYIETSKKIFNVTDDIFNVLEGELPVKPRKNDIAIKFKIAGRQLDELQKHTWQMSEAFGLDTRVGNYKGIRHISFYQWDLDCLIDVLDMTLNNEKEYPDNQDEGYIALHELFVNFSQAYKETYKPRKQCGPFKSK